MNRADLIAAMEAAAPKPIEVDAPEWGGKAYIRAVSVADVTAMGNPAEDPDGKYSIAIMLATTMCDENGVRLFDRSNTEDLELIARQPWELITRLMAASKEANGVETAKND